MRQQVDITAAPKIRPSVRNEIGREEAAAWLMAELEKAERSAEEYGRISEEEIIAEFDI